MSEQMTEETESTDTQTTDTEQTPPEQEESGQQQHQESDAEKQAREMGWRPAEEWDGDTGKHLSAEEFIARNERLKSRGDDILKADNARLNSELSEVKHTLNDLKTHLTKADQRAYEKARKEIEAEMRSAVKEGDEAAFDTAKGKMDDLEKDAQETASESQKQEQKSPDEDPNFRAWWADNPWYNEDVYLTKEADQIAPIVARKNPNLQGRAFYDEITKELKALHPDKFKNPKREKAASVEGTNNSGGSAKTKWDQVKSEPGVKDAFQRFVKQGVYSDTKEDRETYADIYLNG